VRLFQPFKRSIDGATILREDFRLVLWVDSPSILIEPVRKEVFDPINYTDLQKLESSDVNGCGDEIRAKSLRVQEGFPKVWVFSFMSPSDFTTPACDMDCLRVKIK
jgi:hypothetical protein